MAYVGLFVVRCRPFAHERVLWSPFTGQDIPEQAHLCRIVRLVDKDREARGCFRHILLDPVVRIGAFHVVIHDAISLCFLGIEMHGYFSVRDDVDPLAKSTHEAMIARQAQNTTVTSSVLGAGR